MIRQRHLIFGVLGAGLLWLLLGLAPLLFAERWQTTGELGDTFGAANALFSALALGGVIVAILLQRHELDLQRQELAATREELAETRAVHQDHLQHLELAEARRRVLELDSEYASAIEITAHPAVRWWTGTMPGIWKQDLPLEIDQQRRTHQEGVELFLAFAYRVDALLAEGLLDRTLARSVLRRGFLSQCQGLLALEADLMLRYWPMWTADARPMLQRVTESLTRSPPI